MGRAPGRDPRGLAERVRTKLGATTVSDGDEDLPVAALLDAFEEPVLLLRRNMIRRANTAARSLLGSYVEGEDVRVVIRYPEASALLQTQKEGVAPLGGLGDSERRWEIHVALLDADHRLIRLEDQSAKVAAERMRTDFVANASHELRTPLAAISGFIETLEEANGADEAEVRARFLAIMAKEARRMQRLIDDLMSLSRVEVDRYVRPNEPVDLAAAVRAACGEIEAGGRADGRVRLTIEGQPIVRADVSQISQLIHNVVGNALKYGRDHTPIEVSLRIVGDQARFSVADQGEGIAEEHLPRLTERFYRVDPGRSRSVGGTGLGLAIVKHIVERHRGKLDISSIQGTGTTVTIWLPLAGETV
jgi:two-component system, OmpR family, phosphate regulon sensor histidine kinase PhoR